MAHPNTPHPRILVAEVRAAEESYTPLGHDDIVAYNMGLATVAGRYGLTLDQMSQLDDCVNHAHGIESYARQEKLHREIHAATSTLGHP